MTRDTSAILVSIGAGNESSGQKVSLPVGHILTRFISAPSTIAGHGARICGVIARL